MARSVTGDSSAEIIRSASGLKELPFPMKVQRIMTFPDRSVWKNICWNSENGKRGCFRNPPIRQLDYIII